MANLILHILETPQEMEAVENLQRVIWPGSEVDIVPAHILLAMVHNGGIAIGAFASPSGADASQTEDNESGLETGNGQAASEQEWLPTAGISLDFPLVGFVFGFPGFYLTPDGPRSKHCSHMLGVHPQAREGGIGFALKRAQWQMVRHQGLDRITWTYDPLLSRNAYLNITRLGGVCNTYLRNEYGIMRDEMNAGLPSDRFQVDWWVNSQRVKRRLGSRPRLQLDLAHFLAAEAEIVNPTRVDEKGYPRPNHEDPDALLLKGNDEDRPQVVLLEIPADFMALKAADLALAQMWREHTRMLFENLFAGGYIVTDFVHLTGSMPRSFYVLSHGESTL